MGRAPHAADVCRQCQDLPPVGGPENRGRGMKVFGLSEIMAALDEDAALAAVEEGFRRWSARDAQIAAVGHLGFAAPTGDCHIKSGAFAGDDVFVIKVATGFYRNLELGLPVSNGFMVVLSAHTGAILAFLHDQGHLTDQRTAMAGGIPAPPIAPPRAPTLGSVGAGTQARLEASLIARRLEMKNVLFWSRNAHRATALAEELGGHVSTLPDLCARADIIVTTTPATQPILTVDMVRAGTRIVAVGADSPGKQELEAELLARARIVVDSRAQCIDHGETGWAIRASLIAELSLIELGDLLCNPIPFSADEIVVADLTRVAVQDVAIAKSVWARLQQDAIIGGQ